MQKLTKLQEAIKNFLKNEKYMPIPTFLTGLMLLGYTVGYFGWRAGVVMFLSMSFYISFHFYLKSLK